MKENIKCVRGKSRKGIVFTIDAIFAGIIAAAAVFALASFFYNPPQTIALQNLALDELTVFDKSGTFKSLATCPGNRDSIVQNYLSQTLPKDNSYAFAFLNVTVYQSVSFTLKCTASGSLGAWTNTRVSSRRLFYSLQNGNQYFGLAEITVGE